MHTFNFPTKIVLAAGARAGLGKILEEARCGRPLVVTDSGVVSQPFFEEMMQALGEGRMAVEVFDEGGGNPLKCQVDAGVKVYQRHEADCIVALGGGAPIDVAKAIALMVHHPGDLFDYEDGNLDAPPVDQPIPFLVAIPTTAGTGSEVGRSAVIGVDDTGAKKIIFDPGLLPKVALLDPELTLSLPSHITAATGMDALTHLVEAFLARGYHPMADGIALEGMRMVAENLRQVVEKGHDLEAREQMLMASLMGAVAFQKGLGITHSLAHPLSTVCDMHHGLANGIMLPYAMAYNAQAVPERFARMAQAVGATSHDVAGFMSWLDELGGDVGMPKKLSQVGVKEAHVEALVEFAWNDVCHPCNPRKPTIEDFRTLYLQAL